MIGFPDSPVLRDLPRPEILERRLPLKWWGEHFRPLPFCSSFTGIRQIPAGTLTDGASIPRLAWMVLSNTDPDILLPSYPHDYLYSLQGVLPDRRLTRMECDLVLRELMLAIGAPSWKAEAVYAAVRAFGRAAWERDDSHKLATR